MVSLFEALISKVENSSIGFAANCIKIFLFFSINSFYIQLSTLGVSLTNAIEASSKSTSTKERPTGLLDDKVPRKENNWGEDSVFSKFTYNPIYVKKWHTWKGWGTPQNFFLAFIEFIDELEKQILIKKTVEVGQ